MTTDVIPVLHVADAAVAITWYERLGFAKQFEHRFGPTFPLYVGLGRDGAQVHLSEHAGDATPNTLVYLWVDDLDRIAAEFGATVDDQPWAREAELVDPDGNRLRVGERVGDPGVDAVLGIGTTSVLVELERAMWRTETRGDRSWMEETLSDDFTEFGVSGRRYSRAEILDMEVGAIDATLGEFGVRALGRDAALVTYRSVQPRGVGNRASVWTRRDGRWLLAFHQGTPADRPEAVAGAAPAREDRRGTGGWSRRR